MIQQETVVKKRSVPGGNCSVPEDEPVRPIGRKKAKLLAEEQKQQHKHEEFVEQLKISNSIMQSKRSDAREAFEAHIMTTDLASLPDNWSKVYFYHKKKAIYERMCKENGLQIEVMRSVTGSTRIEKGSTVEEVNEVEILR